MIRDRGHRILLAAAGVATVSCASLPPPPASEHGFAGRFALTVSGDDERRENVSGRFALSVSHERVTLDLATPLGSTVARIETGPDGAQLSVPADGGLRVVRGGDPETLAQQVLGWSLPVSGLPDWIEGRPAAARPYRLSRTPDGTELIEQDGWDVRVEQRTQDGRVRRLAMRRPAAGAGTPAVALSILLDAPESP
ncbi:MAG TPA: outer membrane lipoprotein LolB [Burkholderiaceae bacterium]